MRIMGIDPAVSKPNYYAVWEDGNLKKTGFATDPTDLSESIRACDIVYIESQFFQCNPKTLKDLAMCSGELVATSKMMNTKFELVSPSTWQSRAGIKYGRRPKDMSVHFWKKHKAKLLMDRAYEVSGCSDIVNDDEASAILIAYAMGVCE